MTSEYLIDTKSSDFLAFHLQSMVNPLVQLDKNAMQAAGGLKYSNFVNFTFIWGTFNHRSFENSEL